MKPYLPNQHTVRGLSLASWKLKLKNISLSPKDFDSGDVVGASVVSMRDGPPFLFPRDLPPAKDRQACAELVKASPGKWSPAEGRRQDVALTLTNEW